LGEGAEYFVADLAEEDAAMKIVRNVLDTFGAIHLLVNNAALDHTGSLLETPMGDVRALFEVNTFGAIRLTQAAGLAMRDHGGSIVNITSRLASIAVPTMSMYSASKGALLSFTRAAAVDLAPYNIRVNAVAPGMTRTPLYDEWIARQEDPADVEETTVGAIPLGRLAIPDDVAAAVAYLCSPDAAYITGTTIAVDGGYTAR
jgi:NAD(P)-dependent dehydrogenase (short-subunit alcohol dehydrogenase family)